jgi:hypothetical protein
MSRTGVEQCIHSECLWAVIHDIYFRSSAAASIVELLEDGDPDAKVEEADKLIQMVPKLTKKIAGKSLPIEVSQTTRIARPD